MGFARCHRTPGSKNNFVGINLYIPHVHPLVQKLCTPKLSQAATRAHGLGGDASTRPRFIANDANDDVVHRFVNLKECKY